MKKILSLVCFIILVFPAFPQQVNTSVSNKVDPGYFITRNREDLIRKLVDMPCGIKADDPVKVIFQKIFVYLNAFQPSAPYSDDVYAKAANLQAIKSLMQGGYGIGSVLINQEGKIIAADGEIGRDFLFKASALGAIAVIVSLDHKDLADSEDFDKRIKVLSKDVVISMPVFVVDGENGRIKSSIWEAMEASSDHTIILDGDSQKILLPKG